MGIKSNKVHLGAHAVKNSYKLPCLLRTVVYAVEQDIFKSYPFPGRQADTRGRPRISSASG